MGTFKQGILGSFSGKVGTVIGSTWRGLWVMRGLITKKKGKSDPAQLEQQAKFSLMIKFLRPLGSLVSQTYDTSPAEMTGINKAFSDNLKNAITGVYPAFTVDYSKVVLSQGILPGRRICGRRFHQLLGKSLSHGPITPAQGMRSLPTWHSWPCITKR